MPNGGWHVVETGLRTYGYEVDPRLKEIFTRYRRPLCGVDRLIADKRMVKSSLDALPSGAHVIRDREELAGQIRALGELAEMAACYGFDISGPAGTAKEAVQWLYFGYRASV